MARHAGAHDLLAAPAAEVFAHLDDQRSLGAHMRKASMMMGGGRMAYDLDERHGLTVGSHMSMSGRAFGLGAGLMSGVNFALQSQFRWLLVLPAIVWLVAIVLGALCGLRTRIRPVPPSVERE